MAGNRRIDRITEPSYLEGLVDVDDDRLRAMRDECEEEEAVLSYERRLIHGRLAIITAELERRANGASGRSLIDRLPAILSGDEAPTHRGSFPKLTPPPVFENPRRRVEKLVADDTLARLPELSDDELHRIRQDLEEAEGEVSRNRRSVLDVIDRLVEEVGRRVSQRT